ncbi:exopolysaccharide biosynthesis polyprenyl glycosylphosphotransferase [Methylobacterium sp. Leaf399]|uniref:exopolysaccharide biosynthesis polyprenyl glycosylphosphotransferase n=1 Tax=unclassified Methylobacterium TaxID=2615210 RepID=UPI00070209F1|nr:MULTISPECIES: exopolysaccharide biosynthesis polyprenyl glycosylphosphotransferase [unclassified Methylobacterium]KQP61210.1 exopolysaccharide biosynthesis polyprenyl glycosylphosphotransferase [Methylobacterium sp. Leaf108]KQT19360.1 exopolysaccharide biosynthesis polyprenyl glycosylphosphotransferase [Methylobacterium sp. Leaf399]KQT78239.1 exopolysaccharide biosynthesis polyprenyl glycosylphosphotransferase [Methylobacterium sp. Leaf466]
MLQEPPPKVYHRLPSLGARRRDVWASLLPRRNRAAFRVGISGAVAMTDLLVIVGTAYAVDIAYCFATARIFMPAGTGTWLHISGLLALIILTTNIVREDYGIEAQIAQRPHLRRTATLWLAAWALTLVVGFATKTSNDLSRAVTAGIFVAGLPAMLVVRFGMVRLLRHGITSASASISRVHLVGYEEDIARFYDGKDADALGLRIIGTSYLRRVAPEADEAARRTQVAEDLDLAVSVIRFLQPDDVFILVPWTDTADVERCVDAFLRVPATLHLRPGSIMDRFPDLQVGRIGQLSGIRVGRKPLQAGEIFVKRAMDIGLSLLALVMLAPLFVAVAILIKLDSPGPVFFRQRRYGFNQQAFGVYKFRSMKTERSAVFRQASRNDSRITRVGAVLRRSNIDELPQLFNVVLGEMSLVGPRPHALAHDRSFERRIALYARRHNVKPGITGWAQVHGLRGETLTDLDMERRVAHDLHYIDNWSVWLDIQIMVRTVVSPRAYRNAY